MARQRPGQDWVCVAVVATAHGLRGELKLRCYTERPEDAAAYGPVYDRSGRRLFALEVVAHVKGGVIARAAGVEDRDQALALRGTELFVPRAALPEPEPDQFYYGDLEGLAVECVDGSRLGVVRVVANFGAGDVIEVTADDGRSIALPFDRATVPEIDLAQGRMVVDPAPELVVEPEPAEAAP